MDEANDGSIYLTVTGLASTGNTEESIKATSFQKGAINEGAIIARISNSMNSHSVDDDGIELEIFDNPVDDNVVGKVVLDISDSSLTDNDDIQIEARTGELVLRNTTYEDLNLERGIVLTVE